MPDFLYKKIDDNTILSIWKIAESEDDLMNLIPDINKYTERLSEIRSAMRRLEFLSVRILLSQISPSSIILYKPSGKPYLSDGSYYIGISHSKNYACILLNSTENISVDIEYKSDKPGRLKDRFISPSEISEEEDINLYSTICWSAKETVFKYFDAENVDFKEHIVISPFHFCDGMINIKVNIPGFESEKTVRFNIFEEFVLTYIA